MKNSDASGARVARTGLPSAGEILDAASNGEVDAEEYDRGYPEHLKNSIY